MYPNTQICPGVNNNRIVNPAIPISTPLTAYPGLTILIKGHVVPNCDKFAVNIQSGYPNVQALDVNLHFDVRFGGIFPVVVRNSRRNGRWESEEKGGGNPFSRGSYFELSISIDHDRFRIFVNGNHFTDFKHRLPMQQINNLGITGGVSVHEINIY